MNYILSLLKKQWLLVIILVLAAFLRLYKLNVVPPSASLDEVSIGWNAYSILKTGRDEYKSFLPLTLRAYDDYRPALYGYLVVPFVALFGLTTTAVRFPSVLLSIISVGFTYLLANYLLNSYFKKITIGLWKIDPGHIAAFLLAISPWHIYISRLGHEVNAGLSFLIIGSTCFFAALSFKKKSWLYPLAAIFWALSFGSYQSEKIIIPLLVGSLGILFFSKIKLNKAIIIALVLGVLLSLPTFFSTIGKNGMTRFAGTSAFTEGNPLYEQERQLYMKASQQGNIVEKFFHDPKITSIKIFVSSYILHFQFHWLFAGGPFDQHKVPYTGLLYPIESIFIGLGFLYLLTKRSRVGMFILLWLLVAPIPASITTQTPHALRSFTFLPAWQLIETVGVWWVLSHLIKGKLFVSLLFFITLLLSTGLMFYRYLTIFPQTQSESFGYAIHQAFDYVKNHVSPNQNIVIADHISAGGDFETYMFYLYSMRYDPSLYQSFGGTRGGGLGTEFSFGNITIKNFRGKQLEKDTMYIGSRKDIPDSASILYIAKYLDGEPGVYIAKASS